MRRNVLLTVLTLVISGAAFAHYPTTIKIDAAAKKQPAVLFDHVKHGDKLAKDCGTCHHTQKTLTKALVDKMEVKKCRECHLDAKGKVPSMREMSLTKNPMHIRCITCHKEQKKGPVVCTGCHVKK